MTQDYASNIELPEVAQRLRDADGPIVVLTHQKPDGDAFGSVVALTLALRHLSKHVAAVFAPPVTDALARFPGADAAVLHRADLPLPEKSAYVVIVDTGAKSQLGPLAPFVEQHLDRTLIIDHHLSGDVAAAWRYIDADAAACCEIVATLVDCLLAGAPPIELATQRTLNEALFLGVASDTGWFRFSNVRPQTHELAARLLAAGVDHADIYRRTEQTERLEKLKLLTRALDNLEVRAGGRAALMLLRQSDFEDTGAYEHETERLIDVPQQVAAFELFCVATEKMLDAPSGNRMKPRPQTKLSFRSKPGPQAVNVAELASQFNGGGHARAAGATFDGPLDAVLPRLREAMDAAVAPRGA